MSLLFEMLIFASRNLATRVRLIEIVSYSYIFFVFLGWMFDGPCVHELGQFCECLAPARRSFNNACLVVEGAVITKIASAITPYKCAKLPLSAYMCLT